MQQPQQLGQPPPPAIYGPRPLNTLAVVSLAAGVSAYLITHFIGAIVAIVTGHMARGQTRRTGERGGGFALAGLVLGYAYFVVLVLVVAVVVILIVTGAALFGMPTSRSS